MRLRLIRLVLKAPNIALLQDAKALLDTLALATSAGHANGRFGS